MKKKLVFLKTKSGQKFDQTPAHRELEAKR